MRPTLTALLTALVLLATVSAAHASESPPWNPMLCAGLKWTECTALPGSQCQAVMRKGQILVRLDTCVDTWFPNYRRRVRLAIRRHRL